MKFPIILVALFAFGICCESQNGGQYCEKEILFDEPIEAGADTEKLEIVDCSGVIHPITFGHLKNLKEINIDVSKIRDIKLGALCPSKTLEKIRINFSIRFTLTKEMFKNCENLKTLELSFTSVGFNEDSFEHLTGLTTLVTIDIKWDILKNVNFKNLKNLKTLVIKWALIKDLLGSTLNGLSNLEELALVDNRIHSVTAENVVGLKSLKRLDLLNNVIIYFDMDVLKECPKLQKIRACLDKINIESKQKIIANFEKANITFESETC